jgi:hypothetical protein
MSWLSKQGIREPNSIWERDALEFDVKNTRKEEQAW